MESWRHHDPAVRPGGGDWIVVTSSSIGLAIGPTRVCTSLPIGHSPFDVIFLVWVIVHHRSGGKKNERETKINFVIFESKKYNIQFRHLHLYISMLYFNGTRNSKTWNYFGKWKKKMYCSLNKSHAYMNYIFLRVIVRDVLKRCWLCRSLNNLSLSNHYSFLEVLVYNHY